MSNPSNTFVGFPDTKMRQVILPDLFFSDLLPQIDDLAELKLTLHCFWLLNNQEGEVRYLRGDDLRNDPALLHSLGSETDLRAPKDRLEEALNRAVSRNTLLRLEVEVEEEEEESDENPKSKIQNPKWQDWYFMNTAKGRQTILMIRQGKLADLQIAIPQEARLKVDRPNIFVLYEQNISMLTPLIADKLRDLEKTYSPEWINEAFTIAISRNKRSLQYIQSILKRWETDGKQSDGQQEGRSGYEKTKRSSEEQHRRKYIPAELADINLR